MRRVCSSRRSQLETERNLSNGDYLTHLTEADQGRHRDDGPGYVRGARA